MSEVLRNRYEFILFFDVENGNPNGDPDAGNMPRIDPQTGRGIITDVCLKRKVRNYVSIVHDYEFGHDIYVSEGAVLNRKHQLAYEAKGIPAKTDKTDEKERAKEYMCQRFYDVRAFGAVMDIGEYKCGQVCGPVQFCFAKSESTILQQEITITRMASANEKENATENRTMGRKYIVPYALYRAEGFISAKLAERTGFSEDDLTLFWEALQNMFDHDRSAARGKMTARKLIVFKHESALGNAPAMKLFEAIKVEEVNPDAPPRQYGDYRILINDQAIPQGVELIELI
jgi:CRISPR-associated protein Csd2